MVDVFCDNITIIKAPITELLTFVIMHQMQLHHHDKRSISPSEKTFRKHNVA